MRGTGNVSLNANITTVNNAISFNDPVTLGNPIQLTSAGGDIAFNASSTVTGAQNLTLTAGAGNITFADTVGTPTALGTLNIVSANGATFDSTVRAANLTQSAGTLTTLRDNVTTTGTTGVDLTATTVNLDGLTVDATTAPSAQILFHGNATLSASVVSLRAIQTIHIYGAISGTQNLTLETGTAAAAAITVDGIAGSPTALAALVITNGYDVTFGSAINAASVTQSAGSGTSHFDGLITPATNVSLTGAAITLGSATPGPGGISAGTTVMISHSGLLTIHDRTSATDIADYDIIAPGGFSESGGGAVDISGDVQTTNTNITFTAAPALVGYVALNSGAGAGNISLPLGVTSDNTTRQFHLTAGTGSVIVPAGMSLGASAAAPLGAVTVYSATNVAGDAGAGSDLGTVYAASFTQSAGTGTTRLGPVTLTNGLSIILSGPSSAIILAGAASTGTSTSLTSESITVNNTLTAGTTTTLTGGTIDINNSISSTNGFTSTGTTFDNTGGIITTTNSAISIIQSGNTLIGSALSSGNGTTLVRSTAGSLSIIGPLTTTSGSITLDSVASTLTLGAAVTTATGTVAIDSGTGTIINDAGDIHASGAANINFGSTRTGAVFIAADATTAGGKISFVPESWIFTTAGETILAMTMGTGSYTANDAISFNSNLHISAPGKTITLASPVSVAANCVLYNGTINFSDASTRTALTTGSDLVLLRGDPTTMYNDADSLTANLFAYERSTHTANVANANIALASAFPTPMSTAFPTTYAGAVTGANLSGKTVSVGKNFYANGVDLVATAAWTLSIPDNDNALTAFAEACNLSVAYGTVTVNTATTPSGTFARVSAAENCTETVAGSDSGWTFRRPYFLAENAALATGAPLSGTYTVYDDIVRVEFYDGATGTLTAANSKQIENTNGEITKALPNIMFDNGTIAFAGAYKDFACTVPVSNTTAPNEKGETVDLSVFYLRTNQSVDSQRWNTDATGSLPGDVDASDGTTSTDRGRLSLAPAMRATTPSIDIPKALAALYESLRDNSKNRIARYTGTPATAVNGAPGARFSATADRCRPVLVQVKAGEELHVADPKNNATNYLPWDAHNYLEMRWSEPVTIGSLNDSSYNVRSTYDFDSATPIGGDVRMNGTDLLVSGFFTSTGAGKITSGCAQQRVRHAACGRRRPKDGERTVPEIPSSFDASRSRRRKSRSGKRTRAGSPSPHIPFGLCRGPSRERRVMEMVLARLYRRYRGPDWSRRAKRK